MSVSSLAHVPAIDNTNAPRVSRPENVEALPAYDVNGAAACGDEALGEDTLDEQVATYLEFMAIISANDLVVPGNSWSRHDGNSWSRHDGNSWSEYDGWMWNCIPGNSWSRYDGNSWSEYRGWMWNHREERELQVA